MKTACIGGIIWLLGVLAPSPTYAASSSVTVQLIEAPGSLAASVEASACGDEFKSDVYSAGLIIRTMSTDETPDVRAILGARCWHGETDAILDKTLDCGRCPENASAMTSVSAAIHGWNYAVGVLFPRPGQDPDVYRVRVQEGRVSAKGHEELSGNTVPPTLLNVPVRCPRGSVAVVGFTDFRGKMLFVVLKPVGTARGAASAGTD